MTYGEVEERYKHNPHGYLIGTQITQANLKEGRYIGGRKYVHNKYEVTIDLILSLKNIDGGETPDRLVTAARNYPELLSDSPVIITLTTYHLICLNPTAKQPRSRMLRIGGHETPSFLFDRDGEKYNSLMARLKTRDFRDQLAKAL